MVMMATVNGVKEKSVVWQIYREAMPVLLLTALAELMAGGLLQNIEVFYAILPGLVVLVPGLMQLRGNISTSLAQRLGSATHLGLISWGQGLNKPLRSNIKASLVLVTVMSFLLGFGAWVATQIVAFTTLFSSGVVLVSPMTLPRFITVSMTTALLASLVQVTTTVLVALVAHARGLNPDNITIPVVATVGDILTVVCLLAAINFALMLPF